MLYHFEAKCVFIMYVTVYMYRLKDFKDMSCMSVQLTIFFQFLSVCQVILNPFMCPNPCNKMFASNNLRVAPPRRWSLCKRGTNSLRAGVDARPQGGGCRGAVAPSGFWVKVYFGKHFFNICQLQSLQLPATIKKAILCPCSLKFPNFLALAREPYRERFVWQERANTGRFFTFS